MKIKLVLFVIYCCVAGNLFGQADTVKTFKQDVGFNTTFVLDGVFSSSWMPFTLMYKKYSSDRSATRLGASLNIDWSDPSSYSGDNNQSASYISSAFVSLSIGREFQKRINNKWVWYYGADLVPSFSQTQYVYYQNGIRVQKNDGKTYGVSARPFLGIRFDINHRLYLSAEANLSAGYKRNINKQELSYPNNPVSKGESKGSNVSFSMSPASGLFLYYRF